jgi:hypothetical protein
MRSLWGGRSNAAMYGYTCSLERGELGHTLTRDENLRQVCGRRASGDPKVARVASAFLLATLVKRPSSCCATSVALEAARILQLRLSRGADAARLQPTPFTRGCSQKAARNPWLSSLIRYAEWSEKTRHSQHPTPRTYAAGSAGAEPVNWRCAIAAIPIKPPMPIDSTAVDGTIIIAPFSFSPS